MALTHSPVTGPATRTVTLQVSPSLLEARPDIADKIAIHHGSLTTRGARGYRAKTVSTKEGLVYAIADAFVIELPLGY